MAEQKQHSYAAEASIIDLPIIDISPFIQRSDALKDSNVEAAKQNVIDQFIKMKETGFILLKGHGLDSQSTASTFDVIKRFFCDLPSELIESTVIQSPVPRGYAALNAENFGSLIGEIKPNDLNCKFRIGPEHHNGDTIRIHKNDESLNPYYGTKGARCLLFPNVWPSVDTLKDSESKDVVNEFKRSMLRAYDSLHHIAAVILDILEQIFVDEVDHQIINFNAECFDKQTSILSANYYPTKSEIAQKYGIEHIEDGQMAIAEHSDIDLFTVIAQSNNAGGVQIKMDDQWLDIPYDEKEQYLIVNIGDGLQYLTRNKWKSTKHRVLIPQVSL